MEQEQTILAEILFEFRTIFRWVLSGLIQAFFIVCWVLIQWGVNEYIITRFSLAGIDGMLLSIFQWVFAITTLAPILFFTVQLLVTMTMRTYSNIRQIIKRELDK